MKGCGASICPHDVGVTAEHWFGVTLEHWSGVDAEKGESGFMVVTALQ
jgi:hypothetical protein